MKAIAIYATALVVAMILFLFVPQLDLATSRLLYAPGHGFVWADWPPVGLVYQIVPWITWGIFGFVAIAAIWLFLIGRPLWRLDGKILVFLVLSTALGPGLLANTLLKDHWGRARPVQIEAFGGTRKFTPAPLPAAECASNCAFVSGHAALGFSLVAFAFLLPAGSARRAATAAALAVGAIIGFGRVIQGAHFLSDVVFAGLLIYGTTAMLFWLIVVRDGLTAPPLRRVQLTLGNCLAAVFACGHRVFRRPVSRAALAVAAVMIFIPISIALADRPLALFFHARDPDLRALFGLIGRLGLTYPYLCAFGLAFVVLHWGGASPRLRPFAIRMRAFSAIPAFLFVSVTASGLGVDVLKFIFGRPRPKLLFSSSAYDFAWLGVRADHWSFPSGHSATIAALMTALWLLWPQHVLFYLLVAAIVALSRIAVGAHYLSDVLAGALIAVLITWGVASSFAKGGIDLAAARQGSAPAVPPWPCRRFGRRPIVGEGAKVRETGPIADPDRKDCIITPKPNCASSRIGSC